MAEVTGNIDNMIEQMVQANLSEDPDYKKGDKKQDVLLHDKVEGEVKSKITQLAEDFRRIIPEDYNLPTSIEYAIAFQMLEQVEKNPAVPVEQVTVNNNAVLKILNLEPVYDKDDKLNPTGVVVAGLSAAAVIDSLVNDPSKDITKIPEDITNRIYAIAKEKSKEAHKSDATEAEKEANVVYMLAATLDSLVELGLKFDQIRNSMDKEQVIKTLVQYKKDGNTQALQYYCSALGITEQDVEKFDISHLINQQDTRKEEEDELTTETNEIAISITHLLEHADILSQDVIKSQYSNIKEMIEKSELSIDGIFKGLSAVDKVTPENLKIFNEFMQIGIERLNDPDVPKDLDAWVACYMIDTVKVILDSGDIESAKKMLDTINSSLIKGAQPITIEEMSDYKKGSFQETITADENGKYPSALIAVQTFFGREKEEQPQFIVSPEYLEELDRQDAEREAQERDVTQITAEQKKANMLKAMTGMTKARGLVKSQKWMDNLITNYPDKEIIAEAVVEFLEKQKETDEHFMDEDAKDSREAVFEAIVLSGIDNPELFERMQKVDRETSKVVVKNVIEQVNSSRSVLNNVVGAIQALGKNINEPEQEVEQEQIVEDKPLCFLNPDISNIDKPKMFGGNNARGEEPEDDWTR